MGSWLSVPVFETPDTKRRDVFFKAMVSRFSDHKFFHTGVSSLIGNNMDAAFMIFFQDVTNGWFIACSLGPVDVWTLTGIYNTLFSYYFILFIQLFHY